MAGTSRLRIFYLTRLATPATDRLIYRAVHRHQARRILQLGIGVGQRAARMIEVASHTTPVREIQFTGIDPFEARSAADGPGVTLKMAYRLLKATGARTHLVPGDPFTGLSHAAGTLGRMDLVLVSARLDPQSLRRAWFYLPPLLHEDSLVLWETLDASGRTLLREVPREEIAQLAIASVAVRRAA